MAKSKRTPRDPNVPDRVKRAESWFRRSPVLAGLFIAGALMIWLAQVVGAFDNLEKMIASLFRSEREKALAELDARDIPALSSSYLVAIDENRTDLLDLLLQAEVDAESKVSQGWTPLHWAAFHGRSDLVRKLLKKVPPSPKDPWGRTPLILAAGHGNVRVIDELAGKGADVRGPEGGQAIYEAAAAGQVEAVEKLVALGGSPNHATGSGGWTALMAAVNNRDIRMARILLKAGASRDAVNVSGQTAGTLAQRLGDKALLEVLKP